FRESSPTNSEYVDERAGQRHTGDVGWACRREGCLTMRHVGKHSGTTAAPSIRMIGLYAAGTAATLVAWGALVYYAIQFGPEARSGRTSAWVMLGVATAGAIACLLLALLLGTHLVEQLRRLARSTASPSTSGRHARPGRHSLR